MPSLIHEVLAAHGLPLKLHYTPAEIAPLLDVSTRWLEDQCRDGAVTHVHMARKRKFTPEQVVALLDQHTVTSRQQQAHDRRRQQVGNRIAREQSR